MVPHRSEKNFKPHTQNGLGTSLLGVLFKFSDEHTRPFYMGFPPPRGYTLFHWSFKTFLHARVTESKVDPANYRPISVLSVIAKLFEKTIVNQVYAYLTDNKLLSKYQSGFRPLHSTLTALIDITDNWYLNIDDGLTNAILFIDLKKAFDTNDHEILLSKLELYGFKGASLNLFRDYLSDRTQVRVINSVNSETSFISCGVPQGSILGPLLFLLYINDLPNCNLLSDVRMYADDTNLTFASKDPNELFSSLTHDLGNLKQWLDSNRLSLNVLKTKCLFTGTRQKSLCSLVNHTYALTGTQLKESIVTNA